MWQAKGWQKIGQAFASVKLVFMLLGIGGGCLFIELPAFAHGEAMNPRLVIDGQEVSSSQTEVIKAVIEDAFGHQLERKIVVMADDKRFETTLSTFDPKMSKSIDQVVDEMIKVARDLESMEWATQLQEPIRYEINLAYDYDQQLIEDWARLIEKEVYIEKIEPTFERQGKNQLTLKEGRDGQLILAEQLRDSIVQALKESKADLIEIQANILTDPRELDVLELRTVNAKISSYSTNYLPGIGRAKNVELAASKINHTILMPGEQFSYAKKVSPVTIENGYVNSTVFFNGRPVPGVGGGICQVSSTLYNAHLLAGIVATERRNHSLPVSYVPLGQDATMVDYSVDLKFINTLDYPIYISTYAAYGSLTVELWSNAEALHGIRYEPKTVFYDNGLKADTTLYGYNAEGEVVYERFLHTSVYKKKAK